MKRWTYFISVLYFNKIYYMKYYGSSYPDIGVYIKQGKMLLEPEKS